MKVKSRNFIVYNYYVIKSIKVTINNTRQERVEVYSRIEKQELDIILKTRVPQELDHYFARTVKERSMPYSKNKSVLVSSSFTSAATSKKYTHCTRIQV